MINRKGQELSINVIVGIILGILMLGAGIAIFVQIVGKTTDVKLTVDSEIQKKYLSRFDDSDALYVPVTSATFKGDALEFIYGIHNKNNQPTAFKVEITSLDTPPEADGNLSSTAILYLDKGKDITIPARDKVIKKFVIANLKYLSKGQHQIKINVTQKDSSSNYVFYTNPRTITINSK